MYVVSQNGSTALLVAGMDGYSEVVKLLLQAGARDIPNKVDIYQQFVWTCVHVHEVCDSLVNQPYFSLYAHARQKYGWFTRLGM